MAGAVVYVNGVEAVRRGMPATTPGYMTFATGVVSGTNQWTWFPLALNLSYFTSGPNTIAVEVHQGDNVDPDLAFNLWIELACVAVGGLGWRRVRAPGLCTTPVWRTTGCVFV
jgi:hypothetical protein